MFVVDIVWQVLHSHFEKDEGHWLYLRFLKMNDTRMEDKPYCKGRDWLILYTEHREMMGKFEIRKRAAVIVRVHCVLLVVFGSSISTDCQKAMYASWSHP